MVPSPPSPPGPRPPSRPGPFPALAKEALRRAAMDSRKAFVAKLSDADRTLLERRLSEQLTAICAGATVVGVATVVDRATGADEVIAAEGVPYRSLLGLGDLDLS